MTLFPALHDEKGNEMLQAEVRKVINAEVPEGELRQEEDAPRVPCLYRSVEVRVGQGRARWR